MRSSFVRRCALATTGLLLVVTGCSDSPNEPAIGPASQVEVISGEDQTASAGTQLPDPIVVMVLDDSDRPVPNQPVTFQVMSGGGSIQSASARTDALGIAQVRWTLGTSAHDEQRLEARAVAAAGGATLASAVILATAGPAAPAALAIADGDEQRMWEGGIVPVPPSVRVTDQYGNTVAGVTVTFTVATGGGSVTGATTTSGALGVATVGSWTLGAAGPNTLTASSGSLTPVTFTAIARSLTPAHVVHSAGQSQSAVVGTNVPVAPSVIVQNEAGDPLPGIVVTFTPGANSGSVSAASVTTGANGVATVGAWTLGTAVGTQTLNAAASPTAIFTFEAQATAAGAAHLVKSGGDNQVGFVGTAVSTPPSVTVRDFHGNPVPGVTVTFTVLTAGASVTGASAVSDAAGVATVGSWTLGPSAGTNRLRASAVGTSDVEFTAEATTRVPVQMIRHPQTPTSALVRSEITISVIVVDALGAGIAGVPISFAPIPSHYGQGTVLVPYQNVMSDADGIASVRYVMPSNVYAAGGVYASASGMPTLQVNVSPMVGPASEIRVMLGTATVAAGAELGRPTFSVVDQHGNAIPFFPVTFTVTAGGGTVDGVVEKTVATASPPNTTASGPMWRSGPVAGVNRLVVWTPTAPNVPSVVLSRTTVPPP